MEPSRGALELATWSALPREHISSRWVPFYPTLYFDPTYTRTGWIGQPPILDRHEVVIWEVLKGL